MGKKISADPESTEEIVEAAAAAISEPEPLPSVPPQGEWREVALFVCEKCGKEKRGQAHLNMVCRDCYETSSRA